MDDRIHSLGPVENIVIVKPSAAEEVCKDSVEVPTVQTIAEAKGTYIFKVENELIGKTVIKLFQIYPLLLF